MHRSMKVIARWLGYVGVVYLLVAGLWVTVIPACVILVRFGWNYVQTRMHLRPFDPVAWSQASDEDRVYMVPDLMKRVLPGKTETEVIQLLGSPRYRNGGENAQVLWWVGIDFQTGPLPADDKCIMIDFTSSNVATPDTISMPDCG